MTRPCITCRHFLARSHPPLCDRSLDLVAAERNSGMAQACGIEGRWWEPARFDARPSAEPAGAGLNFLTLRHANMANAAQWAPQKDLGAMSFDRTNELDDDPLPLALAGMREAPWKIALALTVALVGWTALFAVGVGCVWVGWMVADWVGV